MMFLNCPAYRDQEGAARCWLPAEVRCRFIMHSTDGPLESAMIRCPAGHHFSGPIESLTLGGPGQHYPGAPGVGSLAGRGSLQGTRRPNTAPAYYLGRPARLWITATRSHRGGCASHHPVRAVTGGGQTAPRHGGPVTGAGIDTARATPATAPWSAIWPMIRELTWAHHGTNDGPRAPAPARGTMGLARAVHNQWPWGGR